MLLRDVVYFRLARRDRVPRPSCCSARELGLAMRPVIVSTRSAPTLSFMSRTESENPSASVGSQPSMLAEKVIEETVKLNQYSHFSQSGKIFT